MKKTISALILVLSMFSCKVGNESTSADESTSVGFVERLDPGLDRLIDPSATVEVLSEGYEWSEGPLWIESEKMLLFSDVPANRVYRWTEEDSVEIYLDPSGYTSDTPWNGNEPGSNGLALNADGQLVLCQHGDKRLAFMDAPLNAPQPTFVTVAGAYDGKKFNSPNDVAIRKDGDYFFTDPPYGMPRNTPQEISFQGVYKVADGKVTLLVDSITRPNGIAFTPDEKTLLIASSDPKKPVWYAYDLSEGDVLTNGRIFYDAGAALTSGPGLPDGLKVDDQGNIFATGPGGVWIFSEDAKVLGKIRTPVPAANCAFSPDQKTLYITADNYLLRVKMQD
jgi:gluconolactonase